MSRYGRLFGVVLFIGLVLLLAELSGLREHFTLDFLRQRIAQSPLEGLLAFMLLFALGNLIQIPGWVFLAAAVLALGELAGGVVTYLAALFSCALTFVLIRLLGGDALRRLDNRLALRILGELDAHPVRSVALLRILFQTMPPVNYALALSGIGFRPYFIGTLLGLPLPIALYCIFFEYLARLFGWH